jgi:hypothetical protein
MCVGRDGLTVRCPPRVCNAGIAGQAAVGYLLLQGGDTIYAACAHELTVLIERHAARVVAAIFESLQAVDEIRQNVPLGYRTDNSTHHFSPQMVRWEPML